MRVVQQIAVGETTLQTPALPDHRWRLTLADMAIEEPGYAAWRRILFT